MAGGGSDEDNPVAINVVPLVDIIFCLCIFFLCSFRFKQIEGKFETWLPKGKGLGGPVSASDSLLEEVRVAIYWDDAAARSVTRLGQRKVESLDELEELIRGRKADYARAGKEKTPVTIDADPRVPMSEVTDVVNICRKNEIKEIEFAMGAAPPGGLPKK
jgi:biopolymer transport protein ExbD